MRFLGLDLADRVPDYSTIWRFREALVTAGAIEALFTPFDHALTERGYFALGGQLIDASIVEAPRQRLTVEEKCRIRAGEQLDWPAAKARHEDTDARWTVKRGRVKKKPGPALESHGQLTEGLSIPVFGTKSHINTDRRYRLIRKFQVTHAAAHDGARLPELLNPKAFDSRVWADTAYRSHRNEQVLATLGRRSMIHFKKPKDRPMPGPHRRANRARSSRGGPVLPDSLAARTSLVPVVVRLPVSRSRLSRMPHRVCVRPGTSAAAGRCSSRSSG